MAKPKAPGRAAPRPIRASGEAASEGSTDPGPGSAPEAAAPSAGPGGAAAARRMAERARAMAEPAYPRPRGAGPDWGRIPFGVKRHVSPHGQVTAVSMMKDEGPFVIEWVAHHLALGFSDLVVYTNDCSDGTDDMLIRLEELGLVHHRRNVIPEGIRPQPSALNHAEAEPVVQLSDWVMVFDADEFLSIRHGDGTLDDLIGAAKAQGANGIVITWRIFGSGGVVGWSRAPVTEQYLMAAPQDWNKGWGVKTLFQYDPEAWKVGIHRPKLKTRVLKTDFPDQIKWLNGSGREMEDYFKFRGWRSITRTVGYDWVQLNHYAVKSVESYALRKLRGNVNNKADKYNSDYWSLQDRNETRDETMLRYSARRGALIAALLEDPVLHRLHHAALERVEARLSEIRPTPAYAELVASLAAASEVPIGAIVAKPPQARDPEKIAALMSDVEKLRGEAARSARKEKEKTAKAARKAEAPEAEVPAKAPLAPTGAPDLYVPPPLAAPAPFEGAWVENHGIELPLYPAVFSAPSLALIGRGKFERNFARHLPHLPPPGARVLDLGAATGFLALLLARRRPDLRIVTMEAAPHLAAAQAAVLARNGTPETLVLGGSAPDLQSPEGGAALAALLAREAPACLLLGAPGGAEALTRAMEGAAPDAALPGLLLLHGRALEGLGPEVRAALGDGVARLGYRPLVREVPQAMGYHR